MIGLCKAQILAYIEYRTPAIFHAAESVIAPLDLVQLRFLSQANVSKIVAITRFKLAPLRLRRHIAVLGAIHRAAMLRGPKQLHQFFKRADPEARMRRSNGH